MGGGGSGSLKNNRLRLEEGLVHLGRVGVGGKWVSWINLKIFEEEEVENFLAKWQMKILKVQQAAGPEGSDALGEEWCV